MHFYSSLMWEPIYVPILQVKTCWFQQLRTIAHARMMYRHVAFNHTDNYFSTVVDLWEPDRVRGIMTARICDS